MQSKILGEGGLDGLEALLAFLVPIETHSLPGQSSKRQISFFQSLNPTA